MSGAARPALDAAGLPVGYPFRAELEITPRRVRDLLADPKSGVVLIDCRTKPEWQTARIEGARLIPLDEITARASEIEDAAESGGTVVVHCHHGGRSMKAVLFLRQRGIQALSMAGGIEVWALDVDQRIPRY